MKTFTKIWRSSRFFVILYAIVLALGMLGMKFNYEFPLATMATFWTVLIAAYTALDRFVDVKNTTELPKGSMSMGDLSKLRFIILVCLLLFFESWFLTKMSGDNFEMAEFGAAFASSIITYVAGNKLIKGFKFSAPDDNHDGIPDAIEEEYYKWERQQRKNGVDKEFINLEYFLDEHEELKDKI